MIESVKFFTSKLLSMENCRHGFFTRKGGVSDSRELKSLNFREWDDIESLNNITQNKRIVLNSLGCPSAKLLTLCQVHSNKVVVIKSPLDVWNMQPTMNNKEPEADAIVCNQPGIAIGVKTADCVPILLSTEDGTVIAAIHAGWRGLLNGVIKNTIDEIRNLSQKPLVAAIGPCIRQESYEVSNDVYQKFVTENIEYKSFLKDTDSVNCHYMMDIAGIAKAQLLQNGVTAQNIDDLKMDTYGAEKDFFSHRRSTHKKEEKYGCQISVIARLF